MSISVSGGKNVNWGGIMQSEVGYGALNYL